MKPVDLPLPLQPWRPWLGWFEPALADALGTLVRQLSELVGPAPAASGRGALEPDGLGDLRLRGPYERLLASEWLLAEELPDEFLRRAVATEHLFLAPQLRAVPSDRVVVAIFDAGPRQLGATRLGHVAAWVLLARRAADLGGHLRWGVLQAPGVLHDADSPEQLRALLTARQLSPVDDAAHESAWRHSLASEPTLPTGATDIETWWIGAPPAHAVTARTERRLGLRRTLVHDGLAAQLISATTTRSAWLPLPAGDVAAPLLRGEFERRAAPSLSPALRPDARLRLALNRLPLFSRKGTHIGVPALNGHAMMVFKLSAAGQGRPKWRRQEWSGARPLVAAQLNDGQAFGLGLDNQLLHFWQLPRFTPRARPPVDEFEPAVSAGRWLPLAVLKSAAHTRACVIDRRGRLVCWAPRTGPQGPSTTLDDGVIGMARLDADRLVYAVFFGKGLWLRELTADGAQTPLRRRLCRLDSPQARVLFAMRPRLAPARLGALAVLRQQATQEVWQLLSNAHALASFNDAEGVVEREVVLPPGERALGLISRGDEPPALIVLGSSARLLYRDLPDGREVLLELPDKITQCSVCPDSGRIALLTTARQLIVLDGATGTRRLTVHDTIAAEEVGHD